VKSHARELELPAGDARIALAEAAEACAAGWQGDERGGRLALPVVFGLRRGVVVGRIEVVRLGDERTRLEWTLEESHLELEKSSVAVLSIAVVPLVAAVVSPFWPALFPLVPFAAIFGLVAWWLVVSRLRNFGPEEFLAGVDGRESEPGVVR